MALDQWIFSWPMVWICLDHMSSWVRVKWTPDGHCLKGAVVIGVPVWPPTHQLLYKYRYRMLAGMISNQRSMVIDTADGGPTVWLFFYKLWTSPLLTSGQGERNSQVSQAYWANQGLLLFRTSIYGSFTSIVDSGSKQLAKASFKQMQDCFEYFENGHGKRLPPTCIMCGCPVEIRSLHVYLDSSMKLLLFKIYGVEPWEFAFRRCSDSVTCSTPKLFKIRDYPIQPNLRVQLVVGVEICPAVTKLSMDVFALSWAIKGFSSSLLGRNLQRNPTLLELLLRKPDIWLNSWAADHGLLGMRFKSVSSMRAPELQKECFPWCCKDFLHCFLGNMLLQSPSSSYNNLDDCQSGAVHMRAGKSSSLYTIL